jgi:hypothetical protein
MNELHSLAGTFRSRHDKLHEQASAVLLCCCARPCVFGLPGCRLLLAASGAEAGNRLAQAPSSGLPSVANQFEFSWYFHRLRQSRTSTA